MKFCNPSLAKTLHLKLRDVTNVQVKHVNLQHQWAKLQSNNYLISLHHLGPGPVPYKKNKKNKQLSADTWVFFCA